MTNEVLDVEVSDVYKVYSGDVVALSGVSLNIDKGSFVSVLGPSGCGKSTLLRILSALETPTQGSVVIRGKDIRDTSGHQRLTNLIFQRLALFPQLTVAQNIAFGPRAHHKTRAQIKCIVREKLELVELTAVAGRYPHQISGGQQQRVAIARALANEPAVLLLDEPLSSLDFKLRVQMQHALKQMQKDSGTTFIYVTHDQLEAFTMSDSIAVMNAGMIEQFGDPMDIYTHPKSEFVATFVGDTNIFKGVRNGNSLLSDGLTIQLSGQSGTTATVRPESVVVAEKLESNIVNRFHGHVTDVAYSGPRVRYEINTETNKKVIAERPTKSMYKPQIGQAVEFGWDAESAFVLSA